MADKLLTLQGEVMERAQSSDASGATASAHGHRHTSAHGRTDGSTGYSSDPGELTDEERYVMVPELPDVQV